MYLKSLLCVYKKVILALSQWIACACVKQMFRHILYVLVFY